MSIQLGSNAWKKKEDPEVVAASKSMRPLSGKRKKKKDQEAVSGDSWNYWLWNDWKG